MDLSSKAMIRGRGKRRIGGDDFVMTEIPLEIQSEILIRLPAKSLMKFKCVSKLWFSLIRSRYLSNRYYLTAASTPRLYMSFVDHGHRGYKLPRESFLISLSSSSFSNSDVSFDQDLILPGMGGDNMVALRGLILYMVRRKACLYNPATRQSITLPAVKSKIFSQEAFRKHVFYFFGHDPVLDEYKVIYNAVICSQFFERITSEHWVLVLEAGGSWKRVEFNGQPHCPARPGLCINGVIYYLASTSTSRSIVVSFDVRSQMFNTFQVPLTMSALHKEMGFIEYGGKPAIFDHNHLVPMGLVDLWVLEDGGRWSTKSLVLQPCHMHLVDNNTKLFVHGTTQNGEVILAPLGLISPYYILYYDVQKNDLGKVIIRGIPDNWYGKLNKVYNTLNLYMCIMDKSKSIMHLETKKTTPSLIFYPPF